VLAPAIVVTLKAQADRGRRRKCAIAASRSSAGDRMADLVARSDSQKAAEGGRLRNVHSQFDLAGILRSRFRSKCRSAQGQERRLVRMAGETPRWKRCATPIRAPCRGEQKKIATDIKKGSYGQVSTFRLGQYRVRQNACGHRSPALYDGPGHDGILETYDKSGVETQPSGRRLSAPADAAAVFFCRFRR